MTIANVSESFSGSDPVSVIARGVSSAVVTACTFAVGRSLVGVTVIDTVAAALVSEPSLTVKVKLSEPLKFASGVYVTFGAVPESVPLPG